MLDIWKSLKDFVSINQKKIHIGNPVFQLHYKVTVTILLVFSVLVTSKQYLGDPIDCISSVDVKSIADKYCWIHSTFTRGRPNGEGKWSYEAVEESEIEPGIRPAVEGDQLIYHYYYQWVWAVLFLQAGLFYFPHWVWKYCEGGRIKTLVSDLNLCVLSPDDISSHKESILQYFTPNRGHHTTYVAKYILSEILNTLNVFSQMFLLNLFLNYEFTKYGAHVFDLPSKRPFLRHDPLARVFPTVTACRIGTGGVAFGTNEYDLLCILPINILNEKIFIFLWFWFILVAIVSVLNLLYRFITIIIPPLRRYILRKHARRVGKGYSNRELSFSYGDWFILNKLGENMNPVIFGELLCDLSSKEEKDSEPLLLNSINNVKA